MTTASVIALATYRYPAGSLAMSSDYGLVEVFAQDGWMRGVLYEHHEELDLAGEDEDVVFSENIEVREAWVHVSQLRPADLRQDIHTLIGRGLLIKTDIS